MVRFPKGSLGILDHLVQQPIGEFIALLSRRRNKHEGRAASRYAPTLHIALPLRPTRLPKIRVKPGSEFYSLRLESLVPFAVIGISALDDVLNRHAFSFITTPTSYVGTLHGRLQAG